MVERVAGIALLTMFLRVFDVSLRYHTCVFQMTEDVIVITLLIERLEGLFLILVPDRNR